MEMPGVFFFGAGAASAGAILMMQNQDTLDRVVAILILLICISTLILIPDLFRPWSFAVTRDGIELNAARFRAARFIPWGDVTGIDVHRQEIEGSNQFFVVYVAGVAEVWLGPAEFHRSITKTLEILRHFRSAGPHGALTGRSVNGEARQGL
jgi:hypothetical protein